MSADPEATMDLPVIESLEPLPPFRADTLPGPARYATFGEMLAATMPGFDILPCLRCGTAFTGYDAALLHQDRVLRPLMRLARDAGWGADDWGVWCCPSCLAASPPSAGDSGEWMPEALRTHLETIAEHERKAQATMTAGGRYEWDREAWRREWRPRPERCAPDPLWLTAEASAA